MNLIVRVNSGEVLIGEHEAFSGNMDQLLDEIDALIKNRRVASVVTPNVDQVLNLSKSREFADAFAAADLRILDGMPIVWLARSLGAKSAQRLTGADLLPAAASVAVERDWEVVIAGGDERVSRLAADRLNAEHQFGRVRSVNFPFIKSVDDPRSREVIDALRGEKPAVVFLCLGSPKQELWIERWRAELPPSVYIGAGAAADFVAGKTKRAPMLAQRLSLEWVWRLAQEPLRLAQRYLIQGPKFIRIVARSYRKLK